MNQPWLLKAAALQILRLLPTSAYDFLTKRITKRSGRRKLFVDETGKPSKYFSNAQKHANILKRFIDCETDLVLEFGAGKDLLSNLVMRSFGVKNQLTVDLNPLVRRAYLNNVLMQMPPGSLDIDTFSDNCEAELQSLGITYIAPLDLRQTDMESGSISAIVSTNTLEHIPERDIGLILKECFRLLRSGGICSFKIDYSDHYAHTDRQLSEYSYLRFSDTTWRFLSPPNHYQNRLRHCDYAARFSDSSFHIVVDEPTLQEGRVNDLRRIRVAKKFRSYLVEELLPTSGWFVLMKD